MAVRIRLTRCGRRNQPLYRIGVFDSKAKRDGKSLEILGTYGPLTADDQKKVSLKDDRVKYWLSVGAQPTDKVRVILKKRGLL